ncbi:MAG: FG-GAP repeat protein [Gemmatimonadaceae bacterium]|nr:FG-GAP repeat protein [Chitinophagaceae bacterium]
MLTGDFNGDGQQDIILAGNEYGIPVSTGRYDASFGMILEGDGRGGFQPEKKRKLILDGDIRSLNLISLKSNKKLLLVAPNDAAIQSFIFN